MSDGYKPPFTMTEEITNLVIERNSLTIDQVSDVIDGKRVLGPPKDIREVQNAYDAYDVGFGERSGDF